MTRSEKLLGVSKKIFLVLVFLIPLNLGKHLEIQDAYLDGVLIDYLIPTIYLQDILSLLIITLWFISEGFTGLLKTMSNLANRRDVQVALVFIFALFLSTLSSFRFIPSLYGWFRLFLYFCIFLYVIEETHVEEYLFKILDVISISVLLVGFLGILQFLTKGSVFDNYLFFGEQPYSSSTVGIAKELFLGKVVYPSYGLFRHPNVFGGFLSIMLVWLFSFIKKRKLYIFSFITGVASLAFTFSYVSWGVFVIGIIYHLLVSKNPTRIKFIKNSLVIVTVLVCILTMLGSLLIKTDNTRNPSIYRRAALARSAISISKEFPFFGVGFNNSTLLVDRYAADSKDIRFSQPVHNIFLLTLSEGGYFSAALLILFLSFTFKKLLNSSYFHIFLITFLQIIIIGSFDHYMMTAHQTLLLFWLVAGLAVQ